MCGVHTWGGALIGLQMYCTSGDAARLLLHAVVLSICVAHP
jgi:hypothetical protein